MADPALFESAWLKWAWAVSHTHTLESSGADWIHNPDRLSGITLAKYYDAKYHRIEVVIARIKPLPLEIGLALGDIAHNFRSCLDHIAWALVTRGRTPPDTLTPKRRNRIYFPINSDRLEFNAVLPRKLPGVRRADIAIVRRYQPYHGGKRKSPHHAFAVLNRLSNDDKHRAVQPALTVPRGVTYDITNERDCVVTRVPVSFVVQGPLEVGTHLAPIYVRKTGPEPDVEVKGQLAAQPALQQGTPLKEWLERMPGIVSYLLRELSPDPPTELLAKLGH